MPYIKEKDREKYNRDISSLLKSLTESDNYQGDLNYIISKLIWESWDDLIWKYQGGGYTHGNNLVGVLECVKQEFYRRCLANYEDEKIIENGDIV